MLGSVFGGAGSGGAAGASFNFATATSGDPGAGKALLNHATPASATQINISETDAAGNSLSALLATFDDPVALYRGRLTIQSTTNPGIFAVFNLTGAMTDAGAYDTFPVAIVPGQSNGTFTAGMAVAISFNPAGIDSTFTIGKGAGLAAAQHVP